MFIKLVCDVDTWIVFLRSCQNIKVLFLGKIKTLCNLASVNVTCKVGVCWLLVINIISTISQELQKSNKDRFP